MPTALNLLLPWQFSPTVLLTVALASGLYARGLVRSAEAPPLPRRLAYFCGVGCVYLALQTACDYYASHMFFVLQLQHFVLHDLGPALLAASAPGATLLRGLPQSVRSRLLTVQGHEALRRVLLDARFAAVLYVVSQLVWLLPPVVFDVMLSNRLFKLMNWSTVLGALPFWHLMLDPRSYPQARLRLRHRFLVLYLAMLPMALTSAALAFSQTNWYPVYAVCGRFLPISPVMDQELGGTAMWVPGAALFGLVFFLFIGRRVDRAQAAPAGAGVGRHGAAPAGARALCGRSAPPA